MRQFYINQIYKKQETISLWRLVDGSIVNRLCFLSIKDCKCNLNGSTGCSPSGTCICKEKYGGSKCQEGRLNSIFKPLSIFWFYALMVFMRTVFLKRFCFPNLCVLISGFEKSSFSLGYSLFYNFLLLFIFYFINELRTRKGWICYFLALSYISKVNLDTQK